MVKKRMKTIFLDRDGVINRDPGGWTKYNYVTKWSDFHFLPGVFAALRKLKSRGYRVIIISNQAGVNRGHFTKAELKNIDQRMRRRIIAHGGKIERSYYCVHRPEEDCSCRKPKTGLFDKAMSVRRIDVKAAYYVGDTLIDVEAGINAGLLTVLLLTGKTSSADLRKKKVSPEHVCLSLKEAVDYIINLESKKDIYER